MTTVILMCAGKAERWGNHLGIPKHLINIEGETILSRAVRLIKENLPDHKIYIVAFDPRYEIEGTERREPNHAPNDFVDTDKFLSSSDLWSDENRTIVIYGDCYFTDEAMKTICTYNKEDFTFFGREGGSTITGGWWGELWGISFLPKDNDFMKKSMVTVKTKLKSGEIPRGGGWEVYKQTQGISLTEHKIVNNFIEINDWTDDFDESREYDEWIKRRKDYKCPTSDS